jgi:Flp pilus assembly protein TadG
MSLRAINATTLWLPRLLKRFAGDRRGVSAIEFAILAPVMIALYLGMVEVSDGIGADRKVSLTASTLANLTAQYTTLSTSDMTNILDASSAIIVPYSASNLSMTVTCLSIDANKNVTVMWSVARNTSALSGAVSIPTDLQVPSTQLILAKVSYAYTPIVGYTITGTLNMSDRMYMAPRISAPKYNGIACDPSS